MSKHNKANDKQVVAFNGIQRSFHMCLIIFIFLFILTGLPIFSHSFEWVAYLIAISMDFPNFSNVVLADGVQFARTLHRVVAVLFVLAAIPFVIHMLINIRKWKIWPDEGWGPSYLISGLKNVFITYTQFKHGRMGKYNTAQKLMAWSIIGMILTLLLSGIILMYRDTFPVQIQELARVAHALCFIGLVISIVMHIYFAIFPMNRAGFHAMFRDGGNLPLEVVKHHHPIWYEQLKKEDNDL